MTATAQRTGRAAECLDYQDKVHARTRRLLVLVPSADIEWAPAAGKFTFGDLADGTDGVLAYYDRLHAESRALFATLTDVRLDEKCLTPAGTPITVWKWWRAHFEHEAHHRGQLYLMLGLRGVPTPPIYGLTAEEVVARSA